MNNQIQIGILEDHVATARGIKAQLENNPRLAVTWMAHYYQDLEENLAGNPTNLLILDVGLPKSPEEPDPYPIFNEIPRLLENHPEIKIMVISMHNRPALFKQVKNAGASGYILKTDADSFNRLDEILLDVVENESIYFSPEVMEVLARPEEIPELTKRQHEVLLLIANQPGISNAKLADKLVVASSTIRNHLSDIYIKLGVSSRASAILKAQELGLLTSGAENLSLTQDD
jgi:two-component system NarL family response regulator